MEKVTYTPAEFAAIFGKERTWAYRQLYAGKLQAVTGFGRTLIPKSEVDRMLKEAGRYLGANAKPRKQSPLQKAPAPTPSPKSGGNAWNNALNLRRNGQNSETGQPKKAKKDTPNPDSASAARKAAYRRLTGQ